MTARREARRQATTTPDGAPVELADPRAPVWHDRDAYRVYMAEQGWADGIPPGDRMGPGTHPENRRAAAAAAWGVDHGITDGDPHAPDWHRLRAMGLVP